ncbi:MAG: DMT family transporter [Clostridia bacterium]|nr:DMT family transporter [Clostridia bacterium]
MKDNTKGMLMMLACPVIWSFSGLLAKGIPWPGLCLAGWRGALSALTIFVYMRMAKIRFVVNRYSIGSAISVGLTILLYFFALKRTTAASAVALQYVEPAFFLLFSMALLHKKYKPGDFLVVIAAFAGTACVFAASGDTGSLIGNAVALLSGATYAMQIIFMTDQELDVRLTGLMLGNLFAGVGIFTADITTLPMGGGIFWIVLLCGLFQVSVPHILMGYAMRLTTPLACALIATVEIVLGPIWVFLFLGERPPLLAILGAAIIGGAVAIWCVRSAKQEAAACEAEG